MNQMPSALKNLASPVDVQQWVLEDLAATLTWLEQQNDRVQIITINLFILKQLAFT